MKIKLSDIEPNPFKRHIEGGKIDPARVEKVLESADRNEFWHGWHVRETVDGKYELLWGHHRLAAAVKLFGKNYEITPTVYEHTDEQMFSSLANENVKDNNPQEKMDVIGYAQEYLSKHAEACKFISSDPRGPVENPKGAGGGPRGPAPSKFARKDDQHVHGSAQCIASFLGDKNWPLSTIKRYMKMSTLDPSVKVKVAPPTGSRKDVGHGIKPGELRQSDAVAIADLSPAAQRAAVKVIADDPTLIIPASEVKRVVEETKELPKEKQPEAVTKKLKEAAKTAKDEQQARRESFRRNLPPPRSRKGPDKSLLQMAERIVKEGQRALATKLHPDRGGTNEQMAELNAAVSWLRSLISRQTI